MMKARTLDTKRRKQEVATVSVNHLGSQTVTETRVKARYWRTRAVIQNAIVFPILKLNFSELSFKGWNFAVYLVPRRLQSFDFAENRRGVSTVGLHRRRRVRWERDGKNWDSRKALTPRTNDSATKKGLQHFVLSLHRRTLSATSCFTTEGPVVDLFFFFSNLWISVHFAYLSLKFKFYYSKKFSQIISPFNSLIRIFNSNWDLILCESFLL